MRYHELVETVAVNGNWKAFDALAPGEWVEMYHATSLTSARAALDGGVRQDRKVWGDSSDGYLYIGSSPRSLAIYGVHATRGGDQPCILVVKVRKADVEPDDGNDWRAHLRNAGNKRDVVSKFGKAAMARPSATVTLAEIGQAKARIEAVTPTGILDLDGQPFPTQP